MDQGGGIWSGGQYNQIELINTTVSNNYGANDAGGLYGYQAQIILRNSIVANSRGEPDCYLSAGSTLASDASSIIGDGSCNALSNGARVGNPGLRPLTSDSGITLHPITYVSIARDTGVNCEEFDQRGRLRTGAPCDVGSFELQVDKIVVTTEADNPAGDVDAPIDGCSLREAVTTANRNSESYSCDVVEAISGPEDVNVISFDHELPQVEISLDGAEILVDEEITLDASQISGVTINADQRSGLFRLVEDAHLLVQSLSLTGGYSSNDGGAIHLQEFSDFSAYSSTISNNRTSASYGGAVFAAGDNIVNIVQSTLSGNTSAEDGGAIYMGVSSNTAVSEGSGMGGAIFAIGARNELNLINSTIANNVVGLRAGGVFADNVSFTMQNSIIAGSQGGDDCYFEPGQIDIDSASIIADGSCAADGNYARDGDPGLGPLQNNGGPTFTHAFAEDSIARDSGNTETCLFVDQRGDPRFRNANDQNCDVGAYEFDPNETTSFIVIPLPNGKAVVIPN